MIGVGQTLGKFVAKLGLDSTGYEAGIGRGVSANKLFGSSFSQFVTGSLVAGTAAIAAAAGTVAYLSAKQIDAAETLQRLSQQTGASEQLILSLQKRLEVAGFAAERGSQGFKAFSQRLIDLKNGTGPLKELADSQGVIINQSASMDQLFAQTLDLIQRLPSEYLRSATAARIFGEEAGPELINAIGGGSAAIATMIAETKALGFRIDRTSNDSLAGMNTQLGYFKQAIEGIKFNALQSFLTGLAGGSDGSVDGILRISNSINNELSPALENAGAQSQRLLSASAEALPNIITFVSALVEGINGITEALDNSIIEKVFDFQQSYLAAGLSNLFDQGSINATQRSTYQQFNNLGYRPGTTPFAWQYSWGFAGVGVQD